MSMKIYKHFQSTIILELLQNALFGSVDGGVKGRTRVHKMPVEVRTHGVKPPVASGYSIWVENWYDLENIVVK